jgi:hypothetical protein
LVNVGLWMMNLAVEVHRRGQPSLTDDMAMRYVGLVNLVNVLITLDGIRKKLGSQQG